MNDELFTFLSSKAKFIAKLPKERVAELVQAGNGQHFDPGHGRLMKEWIAGEADWVELAREAYRFVKLRKA